MRRRVRVLLDSLGIRLLVALSITVAAVLAVHAFISFRIGQGQLTEAVSSSARRNSDLIRRATHDGMLLNQLDEVQALLERMAEGPEVHAIRVFDKHGTIVLSAHPAELGTQATLEETPCLGCHGRGDATGAAVESSSLLHRSNGDRAVRHLLVLPNEPGCSTAACHAHPPQQTVLGVLDVEMSLAQVDEALAGDRLRLAGTTVLLILVTGGVSWVFVRRLVLSPAARLYDGTQRIAAGDLDARIDVPGRHELAQLAGAFNSMTADLAAARQENEEWSKRLEEKVIEKTGELQRAQRQVLHVEKMASLGKLAATVAHELNNPLSGILTYARLVKRGLGDSPPSAGEVDEMRHHLTVVERECTRCGDVVRNLLQFARRKGGELQEASLEDVLDRSLLLIRHHLEMHGVRLHTEVELRDPRILCDPGQIQQAFLALFVNAVEAMAETGDGDGELRVRLADGPGDTVLVEISDSGPGIPADLRSSIFEPFFSTKDATSGVGLGLAVVYGIVQRHGGDIEVESEPGSGATFRLRLPRRPPVPTESVTNGEGVRI